MTQKKSLPKLFIGSSSEQKDVIGVFSEVLSGNAVCIPWNLAPEFKSKGSFTTFNALCDAARAYDFALFILTADDMLTSRDKQYVCPRDNVVFEMGLFIGSLGPERVLAVLKENGQSEIKIPSDLLAVNMPRFSFDKADAKTSLGSINAEIQGFIRSIEKLQFRPIHLNLAEGWGFMATERNFEVRLGAGRLVEAHSTIDTQEIAIAARVKNPVVNFEDDNNVVFSSSRPLPDPVNDMVFQIPERDFPDTIEKGTRIQGRVLLVPHGFRPDSFQTLKESLQHGGRPVESISAEVGD